MFETPPLTRRAALRRITAGLGGATALSYLPDPAWAVISCPNACRSAIGPKDGWIKGLPIIDAHCHIFNARDIPAINFITKVLVPEYAGHLSAKHRRALEGEMKNLADGTLARTPGYHQERAVLEALLAGEKISDRLSRKPEIHKFAEGTPHSCYGKDVADPISAIRNLVSILTDFRFRTFQALKSTYRTNIDGVAVALFTPSMVDMDYWLGNGLDGNNAAAGIGDDVETHPQATAAQQVELMEMIQRLNPGQCHGFVSFCPWRQVDDLHYNSTSSGSAQRMTSLDVVRDAILNRGFLGVKLYPPMGYRPFGNAELPLEAFPAAVAREAYADNFGAALDEALLSLYRFCASNNVPVMAHAAPSNGAGLYKPAKGKVLSYKERAHPEYWERVLAHPDLGNLQLNLGHFGHSGTPEKQREWRRVIGRMMDARPNVYADLSYYSEMVLDNFTGSGQHCREAAGVLEPIRKNFLKRPAGDARVKRLLYGSDWSMLSKEYYYGDYLSVVAHMYRRKIYGMSGGAKKNARAFLSGNAIRFLGLRKGERARTRLDEWYAGHGLNARLLERFDEVEN